MLNKLFAGKKTSASSSKDLVTAARDALLALQTAAALSSSTSASTTSSSCSPDTTTATMTSPFPTSAAAAAATTGTDPQTDTATAESQQQQQGAVEELSRMLEHLRQVLYGTGEHEPKKQDVQDLSTYVHQCDLIPLLVRNLPLLEFESRKHATQIINNLIKLQMTSGKYATAEYIAEHKDVLYALLHGYEKPEIALLTGSMLRECIKHEPLARELFSTDEFYRLFSYVDLQNFEVAADAFVTFRDLMSRHKSLCAEFLDANFDKFFNVEYTRLLNSQNYVTKRQSIRLLGEILLDRSNFNVMTRYINMEDNLKIMMNLLLEKSKNIQFEAFHVFKVFVANPNKSQPIRDIFLMNRPKLLKYLQGFHKDREAEDEEFAEEKQLLLTEIQRL